MTSSDGYQVLFVSWQNIYIFTDWGHVWVRTQDIHVPVWTLLSGSVLLMNGLRCRGHRRRQIHNCAWFIMEMTPTQVKLAVKSMSRFCVIASQAGVKLRKKETINKLVSNSSQQVQGLSFLKQLFCWCQVLAVLSIFRCWTDVSLQIIALWLLTGVSLN